MFTRWNIKGSSGLKPPPSQKLQKVFKLYALPWTLNSLCDVKCLPSNRVLHKRKCVYNREHYACYAFIHYGKCHGEFMRIWIMVIRTITKNQPRYSMTNILESCASPAAPTRIAIIVVIIIIIYYSLGATRTGRLPPQTAVGYPRNMYENNNNNKEYRPGHGKRSRHDQHRANTRPPMRGRQGIRATVLALYPGKRDLK